jgi:sirohydrochlorin cobaltochelatase
VKPPLLLAAHGTRDQAGVLAFCALTERVAKLAATEDIQVTGGFIELSPPPLRDAVTVLVAALPAVPAVPAASVSAASVSAASVSAASVPAGLAPVIPAGPAPAHVVAVPMMLSSAGHAKGDIPAALARERVRHPGLSFTYARPLGPHPALLDLLAARIRAVADPAVAPAVLLVGRGSSDPDANADVVKTTRLLWEGRGYSLAETAFVSLTGPSVAEGLERCRLLGARQIVVARYFLFPGVLPDRVADQAAGFAGAHPELDVRCADVLGDCDEVAALVYERYHEALAGDIRMNCDMCVYRIAMPGFEDRVGEPQRPHEHPHDHPHDHTHARG